MVSGRLQCLGSCQHLKERFGAGYQVLSCHGSMTKSKEYSDTLDSDTLGACLTVVVIVVVAVDILKISMHVDAVVSIMRVNDRAYFRWTSARRVRNGGPRA